MWARPIRSAGSIYRLLSTPTPRWPLPRSLIVILPRSQRICSMIGWCLCSRRSTSTCYAFSPIEAPSQLYLAVEDIDHSKTRARRPRSNGICERFHKTIQNEFYAVAFRMKVHDILEDLLCNSDAVMQSYNNVWTPSGKTPMQTYHDAKPLNQEKRLHRLAE